MSFTTFNSFSSNISKRAIPSLALVGETAYQQLLREKKPWGRYSAESWSGTTLPELGGNTSRNATTSGVVRGTSAGNGATANITYLSGSATDTILWTSGSAPPTLTMCSLSRYVGTPTGSRVLTTTIGGNIQVIQGHLDNAGVVYYGPLVTSRTGVFPKDNWLNCCGTNSTTVSIPNNILINKVAVGTGSGNAPSPSSTESMCINLHTGGNNQDSTAFSFSQFLIFDQVLTANELVIVSDALSNYLATGVLDTPKKKVIGRYFKFQIDAIRGPELNNGTQMSELTLYKDGIRISTIGVVSSAQDPFEEATQSIEKAFDNNISTKWFSRTALNTILFTYPSDITMNQYSYSTAEDGTWRDPISWRLSYSIDNVNWILIDTKTNHPITSDRSTTIPLISII